MVVVCQFLPHFRKAYNVQERTHEQGKHEPMCVSVQLVVSIVELAHPVTEDGMWLVVRYVGLRI